MSEWTGATLSQVGQIVSGGTPSRDVPAFWGGKIPWLTPGELTNHRTKYVSSTVDRITSGGLASSGARVVPKDSVLVTSRATLGSVALAGGSMTTNQGFKTLIVANGEPSFFYFLLKTLRSEFARRASGTTFLEISGKEFGKIEVQVPPLEEQRRIAEILDTIDETIQATERVIEKLTNGHRALSVSLVGGERAQTRWVKLDDLIDPTRPIVYGILMPGEHIHGGRPVIKVRDIRNGEIAKREALLHTSAAIDLLYARSRVRSGDILFTIRGTVGRMATVPPSLNEANITQDTARLAVKGVDPVFLGAAMSSWAFRRYIDVHTIGQAVKGINLRELRRAPVALLPVDEQAQIGAVLRTSQARIDSELVTVEALRKIRSGLATDLLSGRVRTVGP